MRTLVHRFVFAGTEAAVPPARRTVVDQVREWGVPLVEGAAVAIRLDDTPESVVLRRLFAPLTKRMAGAECERLTAAVA